MKKHVSRPDHVRCVQTGMYVNGTPEKVSWCGRDTHHEWTFVDAAHAALNGRSGGRLVACEDCLAAIVKALWAGHAALASREVTAPSQIDGPQTLLREMREVLAPFAVISRVITDSPSANDGAVLHAWIRPSGEAELTLLDCLRAAGLRARIDELLSRTAEHSKDA